MISNYKNPLQGGRDSFKQGVKLEDCPISYRTNANARTRWRLGWLEESKKCQGFEIESGVYSGCDQSGGDCPVCGK